MSIPFFRKKSLQRINSAENIKSWVKDMRFFFDFLEKTITVYNGSKFVDFQVKREMWGYFIGNFVLTKRITAEIHNKTKKNKRGRMKKKK